MKKKVLLMLIVLAGVFLFVYYGRNSSNDLIRKKANEIANDSVVRKILRDYETVEAKTKEYMMFRDAMKLKNPMIGEKELLKQYVLYLALSKKAEEFGLSLSVAELENASENAKSLLMLGEKNEATEKQPSKSSLVEGSDWDPEEWISAIDEFNQKYLLTQKLEEYLKAAYTGLDFESYYREYKDALFGLWEKKEGSLDPKEMEK